MSKGVLPPFDERGVLPPGDHELTLDALEASYLVTGDGVTTPWDGAWRLRLVKRLRVLVNQLVQVGITEIYIDGSFVEDKPRPGDIDGYFVVPDPARFKSGQLERDLNALDPYRAWGWDAARMTYNILAGKRKLPLWHRYKVELYPHVPGLLCGIRDARGNEMEFPSAFRTRGGDPKPRGIIKIGGLS